MCTGTGDMSMKETSFDVWRLKREISNQGLTQKELSKLIGISEKAFSMRMQGVADWKLSEIQKMKKYLQDISISEIFYI